MSDGNHLPRNVFRAPRIPFDLRCVLLAIAGYVAVQLADAALGGLFSTDTSPVSQVMGLLALHLGRVAFIGEGFGLAMQSVWGISACTLLWWQVALVVLVFFAIWSVFGGALARTSALRLTRDAPISLRESLTFSIRNFGSLIAAPLLVCLFGGFFFLLSALAGALMSIPLLGSSILVLFLFPLVLLASIMILLSVIGGVVGVPLMWAGIATELSGPLDALSRTFSYLFARRFQFLFGYLLIFILMSIVMLVGVYFAGTVQASVQAGAWRDGFDAMLNLSGSEQTDISRLGNISGTAWYDWVGFAWMWLLLAVFLLGFKAYALYVFLGGSVSLYLQLRLEVDGTLEEEIEPPLDEDEGPQDVHVPRWVGSKRSEDVEATAPREEPGTGAADNHETDNHETGNDEAGNDETGGEKPDSA